MAAVVPKILGKILDLGSAALNDASCRAGQRLIGFLRAMLPTAVKTGAAAANALRRTVIDALRLACRRILRALGQATAQKLQHLRGILQSCTCRVGGFLAHLIPPQLPCKHPKRCARRYHHTASRTCLAEQHKRQIRQQRKAKCAHRPMLPTRKTTAEHGGQQQRDRRVCLHAEHIQGDPQHCRRQQLLPRAAESHRAEQPEIHLRHQR